MTFIADKLSVITNDCLSLGNRVEVVLLLVSFLPNLSDVLAFVSLFVYVVFFCLTNLVSNNYRRLMPQWVASESGRAVLQTRRSSQSLFYHVALIDSSK